MIAPRRPSTVNGATIAGGLDERVGAAGEHGHGRAIADLRRARARGGAHDELGVGALLEPERGVRRAEQLRGALDDPLEHPLEALGRGEVTAELEQRRALRLRRRAPRRAFSIDAAVSGEHLEPQVVLVELVEAELGDDDRADDARAVVERDGEDRPRSGSAFDLDRELALGGVAEEERLTGLDDAPDPLAHTGSQHLGRAAAGRGQLPGRRSASAPRRRGRRCAVVVVDQEP